MPRLFDAGKKKKAAETAFDQRAEIRKRAEYAEALAAEIEETDEASGKLREKLSQAQSVQTIHYEEYRRPGSKWMLEHGRDGDDYIIQAFPLKAPAVEWPDVAVRMVEALDEIMPSEIVKEFRPPNSEYQIKFFTLRFVDICTTPGWKNACQVRALEALSYVDAWPPKPE